MSAQQPAQVARLLSRDIVNVAVVGDSEPARFLVDAQGSTVRLLAADGTIVVGEFAATDPRGSEELARLLSRSANATEILSLDNAAAQLSVTARVANRPALARRGVALVADTQSAYFHIRKPGDPRGPGNSLQLEVRTSADAYVTIVDVDSDGSINLLFPNDYQLPGYLPQGFVRASDTLLLPDSLQSGNRAGFYWDYSPPVGTDTLRVFASSDLATASLIRQRIRGMWRAPGATRGVAGSRAVAADVDGLRAALSSLSTRGVHVVAGTTPTSVGPDASAQSLLPMDGDWAATSVTAVVHD